MKIGLISCICFAVSLAVAQPSARVINPTFTTVDIPSAGYTIVWGINSSGILAGSYGENTASDAHGFTYDGTGFTYFDYPGQTVTVPRGINDSNLVVGYAGSNPVVGFVYDGIDFSAVQDGSDSATASLGINNSGIVVGGAGTIYTTKGFETRNGKFKSLNLQGSHTYVYGNGINNFGMVVGWTETDGFVCHGNTCKIMNYPGASQTEATGINDQGLIVGWYSSSTCTQGCAFVSKSGKFLSFSFPGAIFTGAEGISSSGQIVGAYTFDYNSWHGFVTSPITDADFR